MHGDKAISVVEDTVYIYCIDPASTKRLRVFYRDINGNINHVSLGKGETSDKFIDRVKTITTNNEVYNYNNIYQGYYILSHYSGDDYEALFNSNDERVKYFNANFKNTIDEWINDGRSENKFIGNAFQERSHGECLNVKIYHLKKMVKRHMNLFMKIQI